MSHPDEQDIEKPVTIIDALTILLPRAIEEKERHGITEVRLRPHDDVQFVAIPYEERSVRITAVSRVTTGTEERVAIWPFYYDWVVEKLRAIAAPGSYFDLEFDTRLRRFTRLVTPTGYVLRSFIWNDALDPNTSARYRFSVRETDEYFSLLFS